VADAATAIARAPLFAGLARLDLARLAGELEEVRYPAGATIVRQGDPAADGFYVVNAGEVEVVAGAVAAGAAGIVLGPGEGFGEVALLTDSPRTATVVARTDVTAWRLSRARFDALLAHERTIAQAIERTLGQRLASTTHEAAELRAAGRSLAARTREALGPGATRLLGLAAGLPRWPAAVLARVAERTAGAAALAELETRHGVLQRDGDGVRVSLLFAEPPGGDPEGLAVALEELLEAGEAAAAVRLALAAGDLAAATRVVTAHLGRLAETASPAEVESWLVQARRAALRQGAPLGGVEALAGLQRRVRERVAAAGAAAPAAPAAPAGPSALRRLLSPQLAGALLGGALLVVGWVVPPPAELGRPALVALASVLATVPLLVFGVAAESAVSLLLVAALVIPGVVPAELALSGFAAPAWMMVLALLSLGTVIARSGLLYRVVLLCLERLPATFGAQALALVGAGTVLTAGITSTSARIALGAPLAREIAGALGLGRHTGGAAAIGLLTLFAFCQSEALFLTGNLTNLVVHDLIPQPERARITWGYWVLAGWLPFAIMGLLLWGAIRLRFRPGVGRVVDQRALRTQREILGPPTRHEIAGLVALVVLVAGFATRAYHGVPAAWIAITLFVALFFVGSLDRNALPGGNTLSMLIYGGVILGLGGVFTHLRIDAWLSGLVRSVIPASAANPYVFVAVLALTAFALRFAVPWTTASTLLALVAVPIAQGLGFHPFVAVFVPLVAGDHTFFPFINQAYAMLYFAAEGELFSHDQARAFLWLEALFRLLALVATVPYWQLLGLL
jgi:CRP-like cAMP-binding protein/di/tricarboxylate transporter